MTREKGKLSETFRENSLEPLYLIKNYFLIIEQGPEIKPFSLQSFSALMFFTDDKSKE